jgi:F-type H+-transporting ATPase subunit a
MHAPFLWFSHIPVIGDLPHQVLFAVFVLLLVTFLAYAGFYRAARRSSVEAMVPSNRLNLRTAIEVITEFFLKLTDDIMGPHGRPFLPLIGSLGFFILFSNLLGLVPGFLPPTDNLNTTVACALIVFFTTHYVGFKTHGLRYLKHFMGPVIWIAPLMFLIELVSHFARVVSLSMRLFGNIMADHMLLSMTLVAPSLLVLLLPPLAMFLGLFVAVVQTFIFCVLSMVYISSALEEAEH